MENQELRSIIAGVVPFTLLSGRELRAFIRIAQLREYTNGEVIYREGDAADYFYLVIAGRVVASTADAAGERQIELLKKGTSFGIISIFTEEPHSVTTTSRGDSLLLCVNKDDFRKFIARHPHFALQFSFILSKRVKKRSDKPKRIFQSTSTGIVSLQEQSGKTAYMMAVARSIGAQTGKRVVVVESVSGGMNPFYPDGQALNQGTFSEESIESYIRQGEVDYLYFKRGQFSTRKFISLLIYLTENYHFVFYEYIPHQDQEEELFVLTSYLHLITPFVPARLRAARRYIKHIREEEYLKEEKVKLIITEFPQEKLRAQQEASIKKHSFYAVVPSQTKPDYSCVIERIARSVAEMTVGIALGSGGAYGLSHIGVLEALREAGICIDLICGSSMGSVIACLWALGYEHDELKDKAVLFGKEFSRFSPSRISLPFRGFVRSAVLEKMLKRMFEGKTFYDLKTPLKIVAFDFKRRVPFVIDEGYLHKAVAASCAMPGVFEPVGFGENILFDGGVLNPLPVKILTQANIHKIIAVNVTPSREEIRRVYRKRVKFSVLDFIFGSIETMQQEFIEEAKKASDIVIHPQLSELNWMSFDNAAELIQRGRDATAAKIDEIKKVLSS